MDVNDLSSKTLKKRASFLNVKDLTGKPSESGNEGENDQNP